MEWKSTSSARPSSTTSSHSLQPFCPQPISWMEGSVRFMTIAKARAFFT
jgi:hypothetical protein